MFTCKLQIYEVALKVVYAWFGVIITVFHVTSMVHFLHLILYVVLQIEVQPFCNLDLTGNELGAQSLITYKNFI